MTIGTYGPGGEVLKSPYTFTRETTRATETLANDGLGQCSFVRVYLQTNADFTF